MRIPVMRGVIDRRVLVNYRVDPDALAKILPSPFRPQLVQGFGIAGICLIRLKQLRPRLLPSFLGVGSENAAHRIAVEWDAGGELKNGVFIPRRDTSSLLTVIGGGRIFPGVHHRARFDVRESAEHLRIDLTSADDSVRVLVDGDIASQLPANSIFSSVADVSQFFESSSLGFSPTRKDGRYEGLELQTFNWHVDPLDINQVESSFFNDQAVFPSGAVTFDNALLMRGIDHQWHGRESLCCDPSS